MEGPAAAGGDMKRHEEGRWSGGGGALLHVAFKQGKDLGALRDSLPGFFLIQVGRQAVSCGFGRSTFDPSVGPGSKWEPEILSLDALEALFLQF